MTNSGAYMSIKAGWWDSSLAPWDFIWSNKHCIQFSTTNTIYISRFVIVMPAFRSSRPKLFCKKGVLKNFYKIHRCFLWHRIFLWILPNFKENLFMQKNPPWLLLAFTPIEISYSNVVCNKLAAEVWICLVSLYVGAEDFIFTCIFLRIITIFIKIWI